jgi:dTDP-4-amino-4,6-dideoxygalactose transaminase
LRHIGQRAKGVHAVLGFNERLDGLQAALLRVKLPHLDGWNEARRAAAAAYRGLLPPELRPLGERPESHDVYHLFPIRPADRLALEAELTAAGIGTGVHYHPAVHDQPPYREARRAEGGCPTAVAWAVSELSLPMFEGLQPDEIEQVAAVCAAASGVAR